MMMMMMMKTRPTGAAHAWINKILQSVPSATMQCLRESFHFFLAPFLLLVFFSLFFFPGRDGFPRPGHSGLSSRHGSRSHADHADRGRACKHSETYVQLLLLLLLMQQATTDDIPTGVPQKLLLPLPGRSFRAGCRCRRRCWLSRCRLAPPPPPPSSSLSCPSSGPV